MRRLLLLPTALLLISTASCAEATSYAGTASEWAKTSTSTVVEIKNASDALGITPGLDDCPKVHAANAKLNQIPNLPIPDLQAKLDNARMATSLAAKACDGAVAARDSTQMAEVRKQLEIARDQMDSLVETL